VIGMADEDETTEELRQSNAAALEAVDARRRRDQISNLPTAVLVANARDRADDAGALAGNPRLPSAEQRLAAELEDREYLELLMDTRDAFYEERKKQEAARLRNLTLTSLLSSGGGGGSASSARSAAVVAGFAKSFEEQRRTVHFDADTIMAGEFIAAESRRAATGAERDNADGPGVERGPLRPDDTD